MPSYTSIINALFRLMPGDKRTDALKSVAKLHPHSENFSDKALADLQLDEHTRAWQTRHAFEACRGWKWPFWLNGQVNPASAAHTGAPLGPTLVNESSRDAVAIPGIPGTFAGTIDRRGMISPTGGRFSLEAWFRFGDEIIYPGEIFSEDTITHLLTESGAAVSIETGSEVLRVHVVGRGSEDFQLLEITASCITNPDTAPRPITIYLSIRPYNMEGIAPLHDLVYNSKGFWMSESRVIAWFSSRPSESWAGDARHGDAAFFMSHPPERTAVRCPAGLATAVSAFHFPAEATGDRKVTAVVPLEPTIPRVFPFAELVAHSSASTHRTHFNTAVPPQAITINGNRWGSILNASNQQLCSLTDIRSREMHEQLLHRNHWIVGAVRALLYQGQHQQAVRLLQYPALAIQKNGTLVASSGKWAFQGQFLAALADYFRLSRSPADTSIATYHQVRIIARWIMRKRREVAHAPAKPTGLLPPGVTRSGTGMEYQLADNFWALEGLDAAAWLARHFGEHTDAEIFMRDATRYASQINGAIHRELEYGLSQQVPGRLHRAFDAATAAELLDIAIMPEAHRLLRANDWLTRLVDKIIQPIINPRQSSRTHGFTLRLIDEHGVYPARRIMLCLAMLSIKHPSAPELIAEIEHLPTPFLTWPECLNSGTGMGVGRLMNDPESAALFTVLTRQMLLREDNHSISLFPALPATVLDGAEMLELKDSPTIHGSISASMQPTAMELSLDVHIKTADPTIEIFWCQPEPGKRETLPSHTANRLGSGQEASGHHTHKFRQPSNNPTR